TALQFALDAELFARRINLDNNSRVRQPEKFSEDHTCLTITVIVRLKPGHYQVGLFVANGFSQDAGGGKRRKMTDIIAHHMNGAIGPPRQRVLDNALRALRPHRADDDFTTDLLLDPQR